MQDEKITEKELLSIATTIANQGIEKYDSIRKTLQSNIELLSVYDNCPRLPDEIEKYKKQQIDKMKEELRTVEILISFFERADAAKTLQQLIEVTDDIIKGNISN